MLLKKYLAEMSQRPRVVAPQQNIPKGVKKQPPTKTSTQSVNIPNRLIFKSRPKKALIEEKITITDEIPTPTPKIKEKDESPPQIQTPIEQKNSRIKKISEFLIENKYFVKVNTPANLNQITFKETKLEIPADIIATKGRLIGTKTILIAVPLPKDASDATLATFLLESYEGRGLKIVFFDEPQKIIQPHIKSVYLVNSLQQLKSLLEKKKYI